MQERNWWAMIIVYVFSLSLSLCVSCFCVLVLVHVLWCLCTTATEVKPWMADGQMATSALKSKREKIRFNLLMLQIFCQGCQSTAITRTVALLRCQLRIQKVCRH